MGSESLGERAKQQCFWKTLQVKVWKLLVQPLPIGKWIKQPTRNWNCPPETEGHIKQFTSQSLPQGAHSLDEEQTGNTILCCGLFRWRASGGRALANRRQHWALRSQRAGSWVVTRSEFIGRTTSSILHLCIYFRDQKKSHFFSLLKLG